MNDHWHSNTTQIFWTCKALTEGRTITHMDEIGEVKGWRLGAIIHQLKTRYKWPIQVEYRGKENIAHYWLPGTVKWRFLDFPKSAKSLKDDPDGNAT